MYPQSTIVLVKTRTNNVPLQPAVIPYITTAILRLDPDSTTLTSNHILLLRVCLSAGLPRHALPVLDKDIYNLPTDPSKGVDERYPCAHHELSATFITKSSNISTPLTASDVHEYYLLGAHVYIGLRRYTRARLFLELVLSSPTQNVATPLMVEAYKKLILVSLLSTGSLSFEKGLISTQLMKSYSALSKPYDVLADVFKRRDILRLDAEIASASSVWDEVFALQSLSVPASIILLFFLGRQHCHGQTSCRIPPPVPCD
jgi:COP9 signalosome complex subunit 3